jgi:hypothetical protein
VESQALPPVTVESSLRCVFNPSEHFSQPPANCLFVFLQRPVTEIATNTVGMKNIQIIYTVDQFGFADDRIYLVPAWDGTRVPNGIYSATDPLLDRFWLGVEFWNTWKYFQNTTFWDPSLSIIFTDPETTDPLLPPVSAPDVNGTTNTNALTADDNLVIKIGISVAVVGTVLIIAVILVSIPGTRRKIFPWLDKRRQAVPATGHEDFQETEDSKPVATTPAPESTTTPLVAQSRWSVASPKNHIT